MTLPSGHRGVETKAANLTYWHFRGSMQKDIEDYITGCKTCLRVNEFRIEQKHSDPYDPNGQLRSMNRSILHMKYVEERPRLW